MTPLRPERPTVLAFVDEVAPGEGPALEAALAELRALGDEGRSPFAAVPMLHFASLVVFELRCRPSLLVFECNFDGPLEPFLMALERAMAPTLHGVLRHCVHYDVVDPRPRAGVPPITAYLWTRVVRPAAAHVGNPGRPARRIRDEARLAIDLRERLEGSLRARALPERIAERYDFVRARARVDSCHAWVMEPHAGVSPFARITRGARVERLFAKARTLAAIVVVVGILAALVGGGVWLASQGRWAPAAALLAPVAAILALVGLLRWRERDDDAMPPTALDPEHLARLLEREDLGPQNHLASVVVVKDGLFRRLLLRAVLLVVGLTARISTSGALQGIRTIHFAQWALLDRGRLLLFLSNYDGSWGSYLDDFIQLAARGLTAVWTNGRDFPATRFLLLGGARDGVAFKAYSRRQQTAAAVWYSAYPSLTVRQIDRHSALREGLARPPAGDDAQARWLRHC